MSGDVGSSRGRLESLVPLPSSATLLRVCVLLCVLNVVLVLGLAGTGVLKSAQMGDITTRAVEETPNGAIEAPPGNPFVVERPTDVDAFYNAIVRVRSGGPLLNTNSQTSAIQAFHYHPVAYFLFFPLYVFGYVGFKFVWLIVSTALTIVGTVLLLLAEREADVIVPTNRQIAAVGIALAGFAPMMTNLKTGQTTPLMYALVCGGWWAYRRSAFTASGGAIAGATLVKPYFMAPVALAVGRDRWRVAAGFALAYGVATFVAIARFGVGTMVEYVATIWSRGAGEIGGATSTVWGPTHMHLFVGFGPLADVVRIALFLALTATVVGYTLDPDRRAVTGFTALILVMFVIVTSTTTVDAAVLLAPLVLFGCRYYGSEDNRIVVVAAAFLLLHAHPYVMEAIAGVGPTLFPTLAILRDALNPVMPFVQPGLYGIALLFGVVVSELSAWITSVDNESTS